MKRNSYGSVALLLCMLAFVVAAVSAHAFDQPSVNLGSTSFLDGAPPSGPGWYFSEYIQYYTADEFVDGPPGAAGLEVWASINQLIYQSKQKVLLEGRWGLNTMLPIVSIDNKLLPDNGTGLGDLLVGPFLQWDPIMGRGGPLFMHRIEFQVIFPTGKYDSDKALNQGSNFLSLNPYWTATLFVMPKLNISWRLHYLWNAKNSDPAMAPEVGDSQAGQAIHGNLAASYEVIPRQLQLGANAYYLKQVTDSENDGESVEGKEQVLGAGPGALYSFSRNTHLFLNAYFESGAEYRPEGERYVARLVHHF